MVSQVNQASSCTVHATGSSTLTLWKPVTQTEQSSLNVRFVTWDRHDGLAHRCTMVTQVNQASRCTIHATGTTTLTLWRPVTQTEQSTSDAQFVTLDRLGCLVHRCAMVSQVNQAPSCTIHATGTSTLTFWRPVTQTEQSTLNA
jgi:hypothetical protein